MYVKVFTVPIRDATILQYRYIAIFITAIQYNTPDEEYRYIAHCNILIYCNIFAFQVVRIIITLQK